ncbi:hypothetical protein SGLAM104S_06954 [Streptomyces glaucescens]
MWRSGADSSCRADARRDVPGAAAGWGVSGGLVTEAKSDGLRAALARPDGLLVCSARQGTDLTPALTRRCGSSSAAPPSRSSARSTPSGSRRGTTGRRCPRWPRVRRPDQAPCGWLEHRANHKIPRAAGADEAAAARVLPRRPGLRRAVPRTRWTTSAQTTLTARTVVPRSGVCSMVAGKRSRFTGRPSPLTETPPSCGPSRGSRISAAAAAAAIARQRPPPVQRVETAGRVLGRSSPGVSGPGPPLRRSRTG